jgi:hypothetical protein
LNDVIVGRFGGELGGIGDAYPGAWPHHGTGKVFVGVHLPWLAKLLLLLVVRVTGTLSSQLVGEEGRRGRGLPLLMVRMLRMLVLLLQLLLLLLSG